MNREIEYYEQRIKQLEEENQLLLNSKIGVDLSFDDYIPVSLVEENIEELKKLITEAQKELGSASKEYTIYVYQKDILQEEREMKVKDMPNGTILWNGYNILGIKGNTLEQKYGEKYYDYDCVQELGNPIDFSIIKNKK